MQHWSKKFLKYKKERAYFYNFCFFFYIIFKNKKFLPFKYPFKNDNSKIEPKFIAKLSKKYIVPYTSVPSAQYTQSPPLSKLFTRVVIFVIIHESTLTQQCHPKLTLRFSLGVVHFMDF